MVVLGDARCSGGLLRPFLKSLSVQIMGDGLHTCSRVAAIQGGEAANNRVLPGCQDGTSEKLLFVASEFQKEVRILLLDMYRRALLPLSTQQRFYRSCSRYPGVIHRLSSDGHCMASVNNAC